MEELVRRGRINDYYTRTRSERVCNPTVGETRTIKVGVEFGPRNSMLSTKKGPRSRG